MDCHTPWNPLFILLDFPYKFWKRFFVTPLTEIIQYGRHKSILTQSEGNPFESCRRFTTADLCSPNPCGVNAFCEPGNPLFINRGVNKHGGIIYPAISCNCTAGLHRFSLLRNVALIFKAGLAMKCRKALSFDLPL